MTPAERADALAQHLLDTARAAAAHAAATPPRTPLVRVWRRRCAVRRVGRRVARPAALRVALHRARGFTPAHVVHAIQGAALVATSIAKSAQISAQASDASLPRGRVGRRRSTG